MKQQEDQVREEEIREEAVQQEHVEQADKGKQNADEAAPEATYSEQPEPENKEEQEEAAKLRAENEELSQRLLRLQADYDNFRRRTRQEKEEFAKYASSRLLEELLPVVDNFQRALTASSENSDYEALSKGVDMIYRQFEQILEQEGLQPIEAVGQPFNPELHQAIMQVESDEHDEGIVVEEVQKGYKLKDKVLRPSMVKVSM
ncbi:nucleotide exchange factor GrpE [Xylanibacillus composti]|uniref:Protein GrpE n=1 Tax=Xylanibacillus composti TaxID=1572762 RepID=A0A8J4M378_9BACL|nr:nucleotide exchange factor GrpE [Xylanibacillus composti]GIQ69712.1 nucleotide exchange factor GrpE [Xylanibacillus composti]